MPETLEAARAGVHLAAAMVQWFVSGALSEHPEKQSVSFFNLVPGLEQGESLTCANPPTPSLDRWAS
ncbi:hypothetical protein AB0N95_35895 [Streptomyces microflavus]|uniref:hypothetical protein n=1 Tax=Streptomyces microflavus TaxID=1919 RepID=UPI003435AFF3